MTTPKRKIRVKPFLSDLRSGMGDRELMAKYTLSEGQLYKVFQKLVDAGAIDEMELFMRSSLSDSTISKAFVEAPGTIQTLDNGEETTPSQHLETPSEIASKKKLSTTSAVFSRMISKFVGAGS